MAIPGKMTCFTDSEGVEYKNLELNVIIKTKAMHQTCEPKYKRVTALHFRRISTYSTAKFALPHTQIYSFCCWKQNSNNSEAFLLNLTAQFGQFIFELAAFIGNTKWPCGTSVILKFKEATDYINN